MTSEVGEIVGALSYGCKRSLMRPLLSTFRYCHDGHTTANHSCISAEAELIAIFTVDLSFCNRL